MHSAELYLKPRDAERRCNERRRDMLSFGSICQQLQLFLALCSFLLLVTHLYHYTAPDLGGNANQGTTVFSCHVNISERYSILCVATLWLLLQKSRTISFFVSGKDCTLLLPVTPALRPTCRQQPENARQQHSLLCSLLCGEKRPFRFFHP